MAISQFEMYPDHPLLKYEKLGSKNYWAQLSVSPDRTWLSAQRLMSVQSRKIAGKISYVVDSSRHME